MTTRYFRGAVTAWDDEIYPYQMSNIVARCCPNLHTSHQAALECIKLRHGPLGYGEKFCHLEDVSKSRHPIDRAYKITIEE